MSPSSKPKLTETRWQALLPKIGQASRHSEKAITAWAAIAAETVNGDAHADWRWLLADMSERCDQTEGIECPYRLTYLIQLAETYIAVKGDFDRDVTPSVLIEGRNLANLLDLIEPGMTVGRMKAIVYKEAHPEATESVDEIEARLRRERTEGVERATRRLYAEKIAGWKLEKTDELLPNMKAEALAYQNAIVRLQSEGAVFNVGDLAVALHAVKGLVGVIEQMTPGLANAA